jgi:carboxylate-amine ligase
MAGSVPEAGVTLGVEEEFLLVDAVDGRTGPWAEQVLEHAREFPGTPSGVTYKAEFLTSQVESNSGICTGLDRLAHQLLGARRTLSAGAARAGALLLPSGAPPLSGVRVPVASGARFAAVAGRFADAMSDYQICGCHVHVGVPDRDTATAVVNQLRPWLPTLLALSVNSPYRAGRDTGYASWRVMEQGCLPGSGIPPHFTSAAHYEGELARLVDCGTLVDPRLCFWLARPSLRYPTVEIRTADAGTTVAETLLQVALARALVRTALTELAAGRVAEDRLDPQVMAAAVWCAARYGLRGPGVDPWRARRIPAGVLLEALLMKVRPALAETGDLGFVSRQVAWLSGRGTGSERQRAAGQHGLRSVITALADQALSPPELLGPPAAPAAGPPPGLAPAAVVPAPTMPPGGH